MAESHGVGVREFSSQSSSVVSQLVSSHNLQRAKKSDSRFAELHKILVKYAQSINMKEKLRIINEFGDGSKITSTREDYINKLFADTLISTMPADDLDILIRDIKVKEDKLVKQIKSINSKKINDFNFYRFAGQFTAKKSASKQRYATNRAIGRGVVTSFFSMFGFKGGLAQLRKEVITLLKSLPPPMVSTLATRLGANLEEDRPSMKTLINEIAARVCTYYDFARGKIKKIPFAITADAGKAFEEILQGTSFRNVLGNSFLSDKELAAVRERYKTQNNRAIKARVKEKKKRIREEDKTNEVSKEDFKQLESDVKKMQKDDPSAYNILLDTFGIRTSLTDKLLAFKTNKKNLTTELAKSLAYYRKNPNSPLDFKDDILYQFYNSPTQNSGDELQSVLDKFSLKVPAEESEKVESKAEEKGEAKEFSLLGQFKTIYSKDTGMISEYFRGKGIKRIAKIPAIPVVMVNGRIKPKKGDTDADREKLEFESANIMFSTYELLNENLPKIASSSAWVPSNLPILWTGLQSVMGNNGAAAVAALVGAKSGISDILEQVAGSMGLDMNATDPDLNKTDAFLKAYKSKISAYATGGFGKASTQLSQFISGDSLNSKPNPEAVSIDWRRKTFSVKPIPVDGTQKYATGGTQKLGESPTRMSTTEKAAPLSVSISSSKIKYSKKLVDVEDDGTNEAIKVYAVNPWFNEKVSVGETEMSMMEILAGIYSNVTAIAGGVGTTNALLGSVATSTAATAKNLKSSGGGANPFTGSYPTSLGNILQGV